MHLKIIWRVKVRVIYKFIGVAYLQKHIYINLNG